jgi:hypothetical protein
MLDGFVNFLPMNGYMLRSIDADFYAPGSDTEDRNLNLVAYNQALALFSGKY